MKMIIGGRHVDASDGATIDVINPVTMESVDTVPLATATDIDLALKNAQIGFKEWSDVPLYQRINVLKRFISICSEQQERVAQMLVKEMGKPITQARGEIQGAIDKIEVYIEGARCVKGDAVAPENRPMTDGNLVINVRQPLGVVVGIVPFNYPVIAMINKVIPALVMGNSVIVKPATDTPLADILCVEFMLQAGVPANAIQIVTGSGDKVGHMLSADSRVNGIIFTGSTETGADIATAAGATVKRLALELGGNDAAIILPDADMELAIRESVSGRLPNCGQLCCATKRFIVHNSIKDQFIERLSAELVQVKVGNPENEDIECGPLVSQKAAIQLEQNVQKNIEQGANRVA